MDRYKYMKMKATINEHYDSCEYYGLVYLLIQAWYVQEKFTPGLYTHIFCLMSFTPVIQDF